MKKAILFIACIALSSIFFLNPLPVIVILSVIACFKLERKGIVILIILSSIFMFKCSMIIEIPADKQGNVIEINASSIIVKLRESNLLVAVNDTSVYHLDDRIFIYDEPTRMEVSLHDAGFKSDWWQKATLTAFTVRESSISRICHQSILHWMSTGGYNKDPRFLRMIRNFLFQADLTDKSMFGLLASLGLQFSMMLGIFRFIMGYFVDEKVREGFVFLFLVGLFIIFGTPLALIRIAVFFLSSLLIKDRNLRLASNIMILAMIRPYGLTQWCFLIPILLQSIHVFLPKRSKFSMRLIMLSGLNLMYFAKADLLSLLFFGLIRKIARIFIGLCWMGLLFPMTTEFIVVSMTMFENMLSWMQHFTMFTVYGTFNGFAWLIVLWLFNRIDRTTYFNQLLFTLLLITVLPTLSSWSLMTEVTFINIGQGDAILIRSALNQSIILIDTGPVGSYETLKTTLHSKGITHLDSLIITHSDSDHSGSLEKVLDDFEVKNVISNPIDTLYYGNIRLYGLNRSEITGNVNEDSLIFMLNVDSIRILLLADIGAQSEEDLVMRYNRLKTDIVKLGHHGSATSSSEKLISSIQSRLAIISCGVNNYGHPSPVVLNRLTQFKLPWVITRQSGDITLRSSVFFNYLTTTDRKIIFFSD